MRMQPGSSHRLLPSFSLVFILVTAGCSANKNQYTISGTVSGLATSLVLQDNGSDNLTVSSNGSFVFAKQISGGNSYNVTVLTQPSNPAQTCTVTNGTGQAMGRVTNVTVTCTLPLYSISGTVSGLATSVVLQDNGADNLTISSNGSFAFAKQISGGNSYNVTVLTQPSNPAQTCTVTNGTGQVMGPVTNIRVTCTTALYSIGGTVSGLATSVVLQDNGADNLTISSNGSFVFATQIPSDNSYNVTVATQPANPTQMCTVSNGSGKASAPVSNVMVTCTPASAVAVVDSFDRIDIYNDPITTGQSANVVLGQPTVDSGNTSGTPEPPAANTMSGPTAVVTDAAGDVFVADGNNCRVLEFNPPVSTGMNASLVIGQTDFTTGNCPTSAGDATLQEPYGVDLDHSGNLWVSDAFNNRILEYEAPLATGMAASVAIGQPDLVSNGSETTANTLSSPNYATFDKSGNLWVPDFNNNRVLEFIPSPSFATGMPASIVLGQTDFVSGNPNQSIATNPPPTSSSLDGPSGIAFDSSGDLWVADYFNDRVLEFQPPFSNGMIASLVIGQPDFTSDAINQGSSANTAAANVLNSPNAVAFDAKGNLFVTDPGNNRTLVFAPPFSNGMNATMVLGQSGFPSPTANPSSVAATNEYYPYGVATIPRPY